MFVGPDLEQRGAQRQFGGDVEGVAGGLAEQAPYVVGAGPYHGEHGRQSGQVVRAEDDLVRGAAGGLVEDRAQALVPGEQVAQRGAQRVVVQFAGQVQRGRDVVRGARSLQPVQEPQAALGVRQRQHVGARERPQGRAAPGGGGVDVCGERGDGGCLEHGGDGQVHVQGGADAADQAGGEQ
ncbi:hypothetical protein RB636_35760 [Streptomyces chrestomyceticus]|uniref:Uncharacterized protein n=1 Tax=Streptomyces chrestomyceticus TaxID=68185 RepID=A0ABU7X6D7_9ACTN